MKIFMQEYGRAILAAVIGSISISICYFHLTRHLFMVEENQGEAIIVTAGEEPVMVVPDVIKIDVGDMNYNAKVYSTERASENYQEVYENYLDMVRAFEDSTSNVVCEQLTVAGIEQIDINKPGRYQLIYRVENEKGRSFSKAVQVIVR